MKILIYSMNFWPEPISTGKYSGEMAEWLAAQTDSVRAIASPPYYPEWKVDERYRRRWWFREHWQGVVIDRCPTWVPARVTTLKRIICLFLFSLASLPAMVRAIFWRPDAIVIVEPTFFCAPAAWIIARLCGARCWIHIQDFEVDAALDLGLLRVGGLRPIIAGLERLLLRRFDRRSTISTRMLEKLNEKTGRTEGNLLFPNWVDLSTITPLSTPSPFRARLGLEDGQQVALYSGNMGEKQGLDTVVEAARLLHADTQIVFVLCGTGAAHDRLVRLADGLNNIIWLPIQPKEDFNDLLGLADVHLLPQKNDAADLVMPSKLTGMLASGRPIVATARRGTQIHEVVSGAGRAIEPEDPAAMARAIREMLSDPESLRTAGKAARAIAEFDLDKDTILQKFRNELQHCAAGAAG